MRISIHLAMALAVLSLSATAWAQKPSAYPAKGQGAAREGQAEASKAQTMDTYYRAYGACMQGRGYTVE